MKPATMQRVYLREAALMLVLARLAVKLLPSARLFAWASRPPKRRRRFAADEADWVAWSVEHAAMHHGLRALCLPRAIAAHAMLRRRGIASRLCLGVARDGDALAAHAWIEANGKTIVGGDQSKRFTPLAAYGGT